MKERALPVENWGLWKLILFPTLYFGIWALLVTFYPSYSLVALIISIGLVIIGVVGVVLIGRGRRRFGQTLFANAFFLIIMAMGARGWYVIVGDATLWGLWMILVSSSYILVWVLPALNPKLSALLFKEQYTPETRFGRVILTFSAKILPIAGSGGALIGMYGTRSGKDDLLALLVGILGTLIGIGWAQVAAHQFWREDQAREKHRKEL